jgi:hypothetical protein
MTSKLYEFHLIIIFLPHKEMDKEEEGALTTIMIDFHHIRNSKIITILIYIKKKRIW